MSTGIAVAPRGATQEEFNGYRQRVQDRLRANLALGAGHLFKTDAEGLYEAYLAVLPQADRQYHTCNACLRFVEAYGSLGVLLSDGTLKSALWDPEDAPPYYRGATEAMRALVAQSGITGIFLSGEEVLGHPETRTPKVVEGVRIVAEWTHFSARVPVFQKFGATPYQEMASKFQDYQTLVRTVDDFEPQLVAQALQVLDSDSLYRAEKVAGPMKWFHAIHQRIAWARDSRAASNLLWLAVAQAPPGFCTFRGGLTGSLLEDFQQGLPFEDVARRFAAKVRPEVYQRSWSAPAPGTLVQAQKLFAEMQLEPSLERRFARLDEVKVLWASRGEPGLATGLAVTVPSRPITWEKFARDVLPGADTVEYLVPIGAGPYIALTTAVNPEAPPILQWDYPEARNPVACYAYTGGSPASQWGLKEGEYRRVVAFCLQPAQWGLEPERQARHGKSAFILLDGARDSRNPGLAIFPETMRSELHPVRSVIEARSRSGRLQSVEGPVAAGVSFSGVVAGVKTWSTRLRVVSGGLVAEYELDRWD